jgi:hypothetical protein
MNLSPEALEQVLTELADRADEHQVLDRVPAVRGRARRNARRRTGVLVAALTVVIVLASGVAGFGGLPLLRGEGVGPAKKLTVTSPVGPYLSVQLVRDEKAEATRTPRQHGGRVVIVNVVVHGRVPRWSGYQAGADVKDNLSEVMLTSDQGNTVVTIRPTQEGFQCDPHAPLVDIDTVIPVDLEYDPHVVAPVLGPHDLAVTVGACVPIGLVLRTLTVVVK